VGKVKEKQTPNTVMHNNKTIENIEESLQLLISFLEILLKSCLIHYLQFQKVLLFFLIIQTKVQFFSKLQPAKKFSI